MNKLITTESGGHPLTLDDLGFIQDAYREALAGLLIGLADTNNKGYRLLGCDIYYNQGTGTMWIREGYVAIRVAYTAEVYHVKHHNLGVASFNSDPYWAAVQEDVPPTPVTYKNLSLKYVHKKNTLTLKPSFHTFAFPRYSDTPLWGQALKQWFWKPRTHFQYLNGWIPGNNPVPNGSYNVEGNRVFLSGDMLYTGTPTPVPNLPFTILPPELRPADNHMFNCLVTSGWNATNNYVGPMNGSAKRYTWVRIQTDGYCYADPLNNSIVLDGVSWSLT